MEVRAIRTAEDHAWALAEIEGLWDRAEPGTPEGERFEVLSTLVEVYEREHLAVPPPHPIDAILFRMEQQGLTNRDLLPIFKTTARLSEVLNRKRRLSLSMIRALAERLGISGETLVREYPLNSTTRTRVRQSVKRAAASHRVRRAG